MRTVFHPPFPPGGRNDSGPERAGGLPRMLNSLKRFWQEESGQGLVEYALILFLIAIVVIVALTTLGKKTNNVLNNIGTKLNA